MRVERAGADTRAAAIARLVERAAASRPRLVAAADRLAHALTWVVLAVAAFAGLHAGDGWVAIAVLVATCPCALALAAPIALTRAAGDLLARGVALTRASALETLAAATDVVLDKTGTLTEGRFRIARVRAAGRRRRSRVPGACVRARGVQPASAGARVRRRRGCCSRRDRATFRDWAWKGALDGRRVRIGTEAFCRELAGGPAAGALARSRRCTPVYLADERGWLAAFGLEDALRADARGAGRRAARGGPAACTC